MLYCGRPHLQSELITVTSDTQGPTEWLLAATGELQVCHVACAELREVPAYKASLRFFNNAGFVSKDPPPGRRDGES